MRRLIAIPCEGETLAATLDEGDEAIGLLIVSGGNEVRAGAHRGMALLAARIAAAGFPVVRFDRRGVGDATGGNRGFRESGPDLAAAAALLRAAGATRVVGFGNCDAATALALFGRAAGIDALVLANPWVVDGGDLPPPAAVRARYRARLRDPAALRRLLSGGVSLRRLARGLVRALAPSGTDLAAELRAALPPDATILLASGDNTAIAFRAACPDVPATEHATDSHSFARAGDADWLYERIIERLTAEKQNLPRVEPKVSAATPPPR